MGAGILQILKYLAPPDCGILGPLLREGGYVGAAAGNIYLGISSVACQLPDSQCGVVGGGGIRYITISRTL